MKIRWQGFNFYLVALLVAVSAGGCQSEKSQRKKVLATLRLHQEILRNGANAERAETVTVHRDPVVKLTIDKQSFLTGGMIQEAKVIDVMGGFALQLKFERQGAWLLEEYTAGIRGRHIAIFSQFDNPGERKLNAGRWLAAPLITQIATNGVFTFTPDATREEAERIALGLNNVARMLENGKQPKLE